MTSRLHSLLLATAHRQPERLALLEGGRPVTYGVLALRVEAAAQGLVALGLEVGARLAIWLPKTTDAIIATFATSLAGGVFVPVHPGLKSAQVTHVLEDAGAAVLVTSASRLAQLAPRLEALPQLRTVLLVDEAPLELVSLLPAGLRLLPFTALETQGSRALPGLKADHVVALFYTSGSTGQPKGVMLSHLNLCVGAASVVQYLDNGREDRLLAVLPLSFDYGFSQVTTGFLAGACVVLMDYLLPRDVVQAVTREGITGLAGVPPLWSALSTQEWPDAARKTLRYLTNSGGTMPQPVLARLRRQLPSTRVFLMYGLTEAFRSTYLRPEEVDQHPDSIGRAIPNADVRVLRPDGEPCAVGEHGELVHAGPLVALGYWNDAAATALRFRAAPPFMQGARAVWSGDTVWADDEGRLHFVGREDGMLKSSGYRISPVEVEEAAYATGLVGDAVLVGVPHDTLGHELVLFATEARTGEHEPAALLAALRTALPSHLVPASVFWRPALPRTPHGKFDRVALTDEARRLTRPAR